MSVPPIPPGPRLRPYLACHDAAAAIDFYTAVFGMTEVARLEMPDGSIAHAEVALGEEYLYLSSEFPDMGVVGPMTAGHSTLALMLYVENVDAVVEKVLAAGGTQDGETKDEFFGDRSAKIVDPFGHRWFLHQQIEEVTPEEMKRRFAAMMSG
ncbi:MAG: VOC family protein [Myxococcota bacterium]